MKFKNLLVLILLLALVFATATAGSLFTNPTSQWYQNLTKPPLNPPSWVFAPVWTTLYILMAISAWFVYLKGLNLPEVKTALTFFFAQLIFNTLWTPLFFGLQNPALALTDLILLLITLTITIFKFYELSKPAACLLTPYLAWTTFATYLNTTITTLN